MLDGWLAYRGRLVCLALLDAAPAGGLCGPGCELPSCLEKSINPPKDILVVHDAPHALHARSALGIAHAEYFEDRIGHLLDVIGIHQHRGLKLLRRARKLAENQYAVVVLDAACAVFLGHEVHAVL